MTSMDAAHIHVQPDVEASSFDNPPCVLEAHEVRWEDVVGMELIRHEFMRLIVGPIKNPNNYKVFNFDMEKGFLLYGPSGCGKTLIAKVVANEAGASFIHINLLIELDCADDRKDVYVIAATNSPEDRGLILKSLTRKKPIDSSVDLLEVGKDTTCDNYSGADLRALVNEAAMAAKNERKVVFNLSTIHRRHFDIAFQKIFPFVSQKETRSYDNWSVGN
ncbi:cell division control protein 48 homolog C-like [Impatiens glandulifera]|uniref:cell division control protein 48 homolog C-like n=1 Tax=Impatiens glandulifera TaxID=253017 RepID=UPI001FB18E38|nr:cell division control protein 48 homolog C-like [Impatiens glandulifera]